MADAPAKEPTGFAAGDSLAWDRDLPGYSAADGWAVKYVLRGPASLDIAGGDVVGTGTTYRVRVAAAKTAALTPGSYRLAGYAVGPGGARAQVHSSIVAVTPDFAAAGADSDLGHAERALSIIESAIEGRLMKDQETFAIDGTAVSRIPIDRLTVLRRTYRAEVRSLRRMARRQGPPVITNVGRADFGR